MTTTCTPRHRLRFAPLLIATCGLLGLAGSVSADFCVGNGCGADDPSFHCHSQNQRGTECWDQFDDTCEEIAGFSGDVAVACEVFIDSGLVGSQVSTALGGLDIFRNQAGGGAVSRAEKQAREAKAEAEENDGEGKEEEKRSITHFTQMTTALEHERWDVLGEEGHTDGARFGWQRQGETGVLFNLAASYQRSQPDFSEESDLITAHVGFGHLLESLGWAQWRWTVNATGSQLSGAGDLTLYGANAFFGFRKDLDNGHVLSGGAVGEFQTSNDLDDDSKSIGVGAAYGLPLGQRFALDLELYHVSLLDVGDGDDSFFTAAVLMSWYLSERFGLTLGYRTLEGIEGVDSHTFTLGSSTRF